MLESICRNLIVKHLSKIRHGFISVQDGNEKLEFGHRNADLQVHVVIHDRQFYKRMAWGGDIGAAEAWIDGQWECSDITTLIRIFARNLESVDEMNRGLGRVKPFFNRIKNRWLRNSKKRSRENIHQHYDLGNDFFSTFLDPTLNYSSGIFQHRDDSMFLASLNKMWRICRKLDLRETDHLLEIGTGWGAFSIFAARYFGCRVTTTTISEEQYLLARQRVHNLGLSDRIKVIKQDYRELTGVYDKLVSIEMIEAVGHQYFASFFSKCSKLLKPSGMMMIQSIVTRDSRFESHKANFDFIKKYVFPGGCLPSNAALLSAMRQSHDFTMLNLEDIGLHYARTLQLWREQFQSNLETVSELGLNDPRFHRLWNYYLSYCEAGFWERQISNVQLLIGHHKCVTPVAPDKWELSQQQLRELADDWEMLTLELSDRLTAPKISPRLSQRQHQTKMSAVQ